MLKCGECQYAARTYNGQFKLNRSKPGIIKGHFIIRKKVQNR